MPDTPLEPPTQAFASYRRVDNDDFRGVVDQIRSDITSMYEAMTGKQIEIFIDRESIGWGEDWRQKIQDSVRRATVFLPIITLRYFNSQPCLDELLAFHGSAKLLGVTDLLLPIVLFGADQISVDDPRSEVQLIASLNYKPIEAAWRAGYESPEWRTAMMDCVTSLISALRRAEDSLALAEQQSASGPVEPGAPSEIEAAEKTDAVLEVDATTLTERLERVTALTEEATDAMGELAETAGASFEGVDAEGLSPGQLNAKLLGAARQMSEPAARLERAGNELEAVIVELDSLIRSFVSELSAIDLPMAKEQLVGMLESFSAGDDMEDVEAQVEELISTLQFASLMNVSLRKSLRPAIRGLRSMKTSVGIFSSWRALAS